MRGDSVGMAGDCGVMFSEIEVVSAGAIDRPGEGSTRTQVDLHGGAAAGKIAQHEPECDALR